MYVARTCINNKKEVNIILVGKIYTWKERGREVVGCDGDRIKLKMKTKKIVDTKWLGEKT